MPIVANGTYTHAGGEVRVCLQMEQLPAQADLMAKKGVPLNHLELMVVGTKT